MRQRRIGRHKISRGALDSIRGDQNGEVEKLINGRGSGGVSDIGGATDSSIGGTKRNLEASRRILPAFIGKSDHKTIERR